MNIIQVPLEYYTSRVRVFRGLDKHDETRYTLAILWWDSTNNPPQNNVAGHKILLDKIEKVCYTPPIMPLALGMILHSA